MIHGEWAKEWNVDYFAYVYRYDIQSPSLHMRVTFIEQDFSIIPDAIHPLIEAVYKCMCRIDETLH